jgi:hypothetical protein
MPGQLMRRVLGICAVVLLGGAAFLSAQAASSKQKLDDMVASSRKEVRTGENLKLPASGDWHARYTDADFPVVKKVDDNVYLYQMPHPGIKGWLVNSLIVITTDGVVIVEGQMNGAKLVESVRKLTPQPIKYLIVGSPHGDHGETQMAAMPGADKITFIGHAITKWWFENDAKIPNRSGQLPNIVAINDVVGALPEDPKKAPPHLTKVLKVGDEEFDIMFMGRGHAGPDLETYLPKHRLLWLSESFESRQLPSMGDSSYPSEWIAMLKEAAVMKNVHNYMGAHGFMDSPAINKQELVNDIRVLEQTFAEGKRLHDAGIAIEEVPKHWHFGDNADLFFADAALPNITAIYWELDNKLPGCPPCRPRRWQGGGDTAVLPAK